MPKFVIEREIPKIGASSPEQYQGIAGQSCASDRLPWPRPHRPAPGRFEPALSSSGLGKVCV